MRPSERAFKSEAAVSHGRYTQSETESDDILSMNEHVGHVSINHPCSTLQTCIVGEETKYSPVRISKYFSFKCSTYTTSL